MKGRAAALLAVAAILPACGTSGSDILLDAVLVSVTPASPSTHQLPSFSGRAAAGATIEIFDHPTATGAPAATGTASSAGTFDIVVAVPRPSQRIYYAFSTPPRAPRSGPSNGLVYASREGGFDAVVPAAVTGPFYLATADFNLDTRADLAVSCLSSDNVVILLGNGDGTFAAAAAAPAVSSPIGIAAADFDGDAVPDLAVTSNTNTVAILIGDGTGAFTPLAPLPVGVIPFAVAAGDLDGDGDADLAVANALSDSISVFLGAGDGTFTEPASSPILVGDQPINVILADLNGGLPDLLVACEVSGDVHALLNAGGGSFAPAPGSPKPVAGAAGLAAADFDGDGRTDVAATRLSGDTAHVFLGDGAGALLPTVPPTFATASGPVFAAAADVDGDGRIDLLVTNQGSTSLSFFAGDGAGGFGADAPVPAGGIQRGLIAADFNGDGAPDVAVALTAANAVGVLLAK